MSVLTGVSLGRLTDPVVLPFSPVKPKRNPKSGAKRSSSSSRLVRKLLRTVAADLTVVDPRQWPGWGSDDVRSFLPHALLPPPPVPISFRTPGTASQVDDFSVAVTVLNSPVTTPFKVGSAKKGRKKS